MAKGSEIVRVKLCLLALGPGNLDELLNLICGQPVSLGTIALEANLSQLVLSRRLKFVELDSIISVFAHMDHIHTRVTKEMYVVRIQQVHDSRAPVRKPPSVVFVIDPLSIRIRGMRHDPTSPIYFLKLRLIQLIADALLVSRTHARNLRWNLNNRHRIKIGVHLRQLGENFACVPGF